MANREMQVKFWVDESEATKTIELFNEDDAGEQAQAYFDNWIKNVSCGFEIVSVDEPKEECPTCGSEIESSKRKEEKK